MLWFRVMYLWHRTRSGSLSVFSKVDEMNYRAVPICSKEQIPPTYLNRECRNPQILCRVDTIAIRVELTFIKHGRSPV